MRKLLTTLGTVIILVALTTACSQTDSKAPQNNVTDEKNAQVFKIGAIPDQNVSDLKNNMDEISNYLSGKTGLKVEFAPSVDYAALVTAFERGEVQLAWFGGLTGVQARSRVPDSEAIAQRPSDSKFHSVFIAQKNLDINEIGDLKGKTFTFGSESSTSGNLMPRYYLMQAGIDPDKDFNGKPNFSGSHDKTIKLVESGAFQAGALNIAVWDTYVKDNKVDLSKVKVFYTTPEFFDYNWTINKVDDTFGAGTKAKVKEALLSMNSNSGEFMKFFNTDKFVVTNNDNYKAIEAVAKKLRIIK